MIKTIQAILGKNVKHEEAIVVTIEGIEYTLYGLVWTIKRMQAENEWLRAELKKLKDLTMKSEEAIWQKVQWRKIDVKRA